MKRTPLLYAEGPDPAEDRPAHVRAASGIAWFDGKLAIVQDDALFVAMVEPGPMRRVTQLALPRGEGNVRLFDDARKNKLDKFDLEACVTLEVDGTETLVAFGSGSHFARERIVLLRPGGHVEIIDARAFYAALRARVEFAGIELNVEGAAVVGNSLVLASRGNGVSTELVKAVDAIGRVDLASFVAFLRSGGTSPVPELLDIERYDLGQAGGAKLTFTDLATDRERNQLLYVACAEASPDAIQDGPVSGVALGILGDEPRYNLVVDENGALLTEKIEGFVVNDRSHFSAVIDVDDPERPAELLDLAVDGL